MATRRSRSSGARPAEPEPDENGYVDAIAFLESLEDEPLTFGRFMRSMRQCNELTQAQLAATLGISKANLSDIENGRRTVSPARAAAWGEKMGYHPAPFVELALQDQLDRAEVGLKVKVEAACAENRTKHRDGRASGGEVSSGGT
jgi:transcriptional regulator with XRE-family HTH domain